MMLLRRRTRRGEGKTGEDDGLMIMVCSLLHEDRL